MSLILKENLAAFERAGAARAVALSVPLTAFFLIQNTVSLASLAMIGRVGTVALAGIGIASAVYALLLALLFGFDTAVQALVARATGAGAAGLAGRFLSEALAISAPFGILLCAAAMLGAGPLVGALTPDRQVALAGEAFLLYAAPSLAFFSITIPVNAYWIGSGRPKIALLVTAIVAPVQVVLTWLFVFGFGGGAGLGVAGAGAALSASTLFGLAIQMALATRLFPVRVLFAQPPTSEGMRDIVAVGWPVSVQQSLLQLGLIVSFGIVSQLGVIAVAILNVLSNLMLLPIQIATGLGIAGATLVGQSLGGGDVVAARRWGWRMAFTGATILLPFGLAAVIAPYVLLGLFITDPQTLSRAIWPAQLLGIAVSADAFGRILSFSLRGAGATKSATGIAFVLQWMLQLPLMFWIGVERHGGFNSIVAVQVALIFASLAAYATVWSGGRWPALQLLAAPQPCEHELARA